MLNLGGEVKTNRIGSRDFEERGRVIKQTLKTSFVGASLEDVLDDDSDDEQE